MKTAFVPHFHLALPGLRQLVKRPFVPTYPTPFIAEENCRYYAGEGCSLSYKWHDAYDVYLGILEVRTHVNLRIPYETLVNDLHLLYQLSGASRLCGTVEADDTAILLNDFEKLESYSPPAKGWLHITPPEKQVILLVLVPKGTWATRYPIKEGSPMREVLQSLKAQYPTRICRPPSRISPGMGFPITVLLHLPAFEEMDLDDALNGPMVQLLKLHKSEGFIQNQLLLEAARKLVVQAFAFIEAPRSTGVPSAENVAAALHTGVRTLRLLHKQAYAQSFTAFIEDQCMETAKRLLSQGKNVRTVANLLGYSAPQNFSRLFKQRYKMTPREYRRQSPA